MSTDSQKLIPLTVLETAYEIVKKLPDLILIYQGQIKALRITQANKTFACTGLEIERINNKIIVAECLYDIFISKHESSNISEKSSTDNILFHAAIPTMDDLSDNTVMSQESLNDTLKQIAFDFAMAFDQDKSISYKTLSVVFLASAESLSKYFIKNGVKSKNCYDVDQKIQVARIILEGRSYKDAAQITGVKQSSIHHYASHIYRDESKLNAMPSIEIDHNDAIRLIGRTALHRGLLVYSEHISDFSADIGNHFKNIDLVLLKNDILHCAIEVEKSNGLQKSISNLMDHYKDIKYKILFVTEQTLPKAYAIRKEMEITPFEVRIIKLHQGFEETLMKLIASPSGPRWKT